MNTSAWSTLGLGGVHDAAAALWRSPDALELGAPWLLLVVGVPVVVLLAFLALWPKVAARLGEPSRPLPTFSFARGDRARELPRGVGVVLRRLSLVAVGASLVLAALAAAAPRVMGEPEAGTTEGIDLVIALDVSGSMRAADFRPNDRLYVAKQVIEQHVLSRQRDRVALVVFAGEAFTQVPLTLDKALLGQVLDGVRTGVITDGTAIGDGLATSLNRLVDSKAKTRAVVLLTDGDNNAGLLAPESATDLAVELGVKVFPILVGRGGKVPFPNGTDLFGKPLYVNVEMPTNPELLKKIATRTGGTFFSATDPKSLETSLQQILDSLDRSLLADVQPTRRPISLVPLLLVPAALLLLFALAVGLTRGSTVP